MRGLKHLTDGMKITKNEAMSGEFEAWTKTAPYSQLIGYLSKVDGFNESIGFAKLKKSTYPTRLKIMSGIYHNAIALWRDCQVNPESYVPGEKAKAAPKESTANYLEAIAIIISEGPESMTEAIDSTEI